MRFLKLSLLLLLSVILAGCGASPEKALVGSWKIKTSSITGPNGAAPNAAAMKTLSNITINFKSDKTFALTMFMPMEGTWAIDDGGTVTMTTTKVAGTDVTKMPNAAAAAPKLNGKLDTGQGTLTLMAPGGAAAAKGITFEKS